MLGKGPSGSPETIALSKALLLLDELNIDEIESVVSDHVRALIEDSQSAHQRLEDGYASVMRLLLATLANVAAKNDPVLEKQIRMVALRLTPPVSPHELNVLAEYLTILSKRVASVAVDFGKKSPDNVFPVGERSTTSTLAVPTRPAAPDAGNDGEANEQRVDVAFRDHLNQKNLEIAQIRATLARHVDEAIAQNEEFGILLGVELEALRDAERIADVEKRRMALISEINKFVKKHRQLSDKFDGASKYLKLVESSNQQLSDELDRVRLLSLTDELTGLPNRRAFLRRLEDEVGRVKRYGIPITMTVIDLDGFKSYNDMYGHGGGDAVLRGYAEHVLSIFRHHDMVARYGGEEFSVILPNTNRDGALRALQKVQAQVSEVTCVYNGQQLRMPTFSAGLAEYRHGETLSDFIERADAALYNAKRLGRNRIEIARDTNDPKDGKGARKEDVSARRG